MPLCTRRARRRSSAGRRAACALVAGLSLAAVGARAQTAAAEPAAAPAVPRNFGLAIGVTFEGDVVDVRGRPLGNGIEVVARAIPTLTLVQRGGRLQGTVIYTGTLTDRRGIDDRRESDYVNTLSANYVLEAIEGVGFVDARASITQQMISAIGGPAGELAGSSKNRAEVTTVSLSPYLRGSLAGAAEYELRATGTNTNGGDDAISDSHTEQASFYLRTPRRGAVFGAGLSGSRLRVKFASASTPTVTDRLTVELSAQPDIDWRLTATAGQERTDIVGALRQSYTNYGLGVQWTPSPRTTVLLQGEERYFGRAYKALIEHRFSRSTFKLSSSRDVNIGSDALSQGQAVTWYELYFAQYASQYPDPVQRDQAVLALLQSLGLNRSSIVSGGLFGNGGVSAQRRNDAIWTWVGQRLTISSSAYRTRSERVDSGGITPASRNDNTAVSGYAASVGWRLTPLTSVNTSGARTMSKDTVTLLGSDLKEVSVGLTTQLGARATGSVRASYQVFGGPTDAYRQTSLSGSLSLRF